MYLGLIELDELQPADRCNFPSSVGFIAKALKSQRSVVMQPFMRLFAAGSLVLLSSFGSSAATRPSAQMERLVKTFEGRWIVRETHGPKEWAPQGATGVGTAEFIRGPGSESLLQTYRSSVGNFKFEGHGVTWWNKETQQYHGIWCENTARDGCADSGALRWENDKLIADYTGEQNGKTTKLRRTIGEITPDSFTVVIEVAIGNAPMEPEITVVYERAR
jgi:hypothetical protein